MIASDAALRPAVATHVEMHLTALNAEGRLDEQFAKSLSGKVAEFSCRLTIFFHRFTLAKSNGALYTKRFFCTGQ